MKRLSALAQLVALYAEKGITSTKQLVEKTGYCERQIWRARNELHPDTRVSPPLTPVSVTPVSAPPDARVRGGARAYKESTLRVDSSSVVVRDSDSEITTNNSTSTLPACLKKESSPTQTLKQQLAAVDDRDASDEDRFWAAVDVLTKAGIPRSQLVKLAKLTEAFDECLVTLGRVAAAREPARYLAGIIRNLKSDAEAAAGFVRSDEPDFVREFRREGHRVRKLTNGEWECGRWTFDSAGMEIGG